MITTRMLFCCAMTLALCPPWCHAAPIITFGSGRTSLTNTDKFQVYIRNDANQVVCNGYSATTVYDNTWHHVCFVDVSGEITLYIDGVKDTGNITYRVGRAPGQRACAGAQRGGRGLVSGAGRPRLLPLGRPRHGPPGPSLGAPSRDPLRRRHQPARHGRAPFGGGIHV